MLSVPAMSARSPARSGGWSAASATRIVIAAPGLRHCWLVGAVVHVTGVTSVLAVDPRRCSHRTHTRPTRRSETRTGTSCCGGAVERTSPATTASEPDLAA